MPQVQTTSATPSERFLQALSDYDQFLIVMHDNPDPDAIATGWAVQCLVEEKLCKEARLIGGGAILRAENRHMVDLLGPPVQLVLGVELPGGVATILVDCGVGTTNQLLTRGSIQPAAVIDHHAPRRPHSDLAFVDVRPDVAASATIAASYLREQEVEPGPKLATALLYAIRTETRGCEFHFSPLDNAIVLWLTERADASLLAEIECAPLSRDYFSDLALA